jgi:hypothetical protein
MGMTVDDLIVAPSRGTVEAVFAYCESQGRTVDRFLRDFLSETYAVAPLVGVDASVTIAQSCH